MPPAKDEQELGQISVYLAKPNTDLKAIVEWDKVASKLKVEERHLVVDSVACQFVYFETRTPKSNPPWLDFANEQLAADDRIFFSSTSHSANGLLALDVDGRLFIAAFGRSASALLVRRALESDFGIRTAMNLCGNEEIRQTRTQSHSLTPTHIDRQVGRPSGTFVFGLSEAEDLKFISAHLKGDPLVTLQGRDHLTIKMLGRKKISWERLIDRCRTFSAAYDRQDFVSLFPNYRNFKPADDKDVSELDQRLLDALIAEQLDEIRLWIPEFIPDDEYSFSYSDHAKTENQIYAYLDVRQLPEQLKLKDLTIKKLQDRRVYAYSHAEERVISSKWWSLYDCIIFEQKLHEDYFILTDGEWKQIDDDFYKSVMDFVATQVRQEASEPLYEGISIADTKARKNREAVFNSEACRLRPQSIRFDAAKLRIGGSRKDKEFCDILDLTDAGIMRIINCKPYKGSSAISYLFAQTRFYCESFIRDQAFLDAIRKHIRASTSPTKKDYLRHIRASIKDVNGSDYQVCVWLLCDKRSKLPNKPDLPFMAQYELKLMHDHLQQSCKFRTVILRFIPVEIANFVTAKKPKVANRSRGAVA